MEGTSWRAHLEQETEIPSNQRTIPSFYEALGAFSRSADLHVYEDDMYLTACDLDSLFWYRCPKINHLNIYYL